MTRFVTIATYDETFRADIARSAIEDAGIEVRIADREIVAMEWVLSNAVGGIKVQVPEAEAARAHRILEEALRDLRENAIDEVELARQAMAAAPEEDVQPPPPVDVQAVSNEPTVPTAAEGEREEYARRFLLAAVFSNFFLPFGVYAIYLFLNATLGPGKLSSEGWRRILFGVLAGAVTIPLWYWLLSWGLWGILSTVFLD